MGHRDVVAVGASAGGVEALHYLAGQLPGNFPAYILVTIHLSEDFPSALDQVLGRAGPLPVHFAHHGDRLEPGHIYLAPASRHLLLFGDYLELGYGARENGARPAIDAMFRSVALCCGSRSIGVILSGMRGDGSAGLLSLKQSGAITVVQEPSDAAFAEMPTRAIEHTAPDHVVALTALPGLLAKLVQQPSGSPASASERLAFEVSVARSGRSSMAEMDRIGRRSVLTCPDCHGIMWEIDEGSLVRYRCHVGHAYTADSMKHAMDENLNRALSSALRTLEERVAMTMSLRDKAVESRQSWSAQWWQRRLDEAEREAEIIREAVRRSDRVGDEELERR